MGITNEQRKELTKELGAQLRKASGGGRVEHGVDQWELVVDALIRAIEGIVRAELQGGPVDGGR